MPKLGSLSAMLLSSPRVFLTLLSVHVLLSRVLSHSFTEALTELPNWVMRLLFEPNKWFRQFQVAFTGLFGPFFFYKSPNVFRKNQTNSSWRCAFWPAIKTSSQQFRLFQHAFGGNTAISELFFHVANTSSVALCIVHQCTHRC